MNVENHDILQNGTRGCEESIVSFFSRCRRWRLDIKGGLKFQRFRAGLDQEVVSAKVTAVIFTVDPSHHFDQCIESVRKQTIPPAHIEIVRNIMPFSRASQEGLDRVKTPFYVAVDDDMILKSSCVDRLYRAINSKPDCAEALARLRDPILGNLNGVRMYRTDAVRSIGFHPLQDEKGCERYMAKELTARGFTTVNCHDVEGEHHPIYLPHEAFWKFRFIGEKIRYYELGIESFQHHLEKLIEYRRRTGNIVALYGMSGLFDGLQTEDVSQTLTYQGRNDHPAFVKFHRFIHKWAPQVLENVHRGGK